jgi:hypothetical protein
VAALAPGDVDAAAPSASVRELLDPGRRDLDRWAGIHPALDPLLDRHLEQDVDRDRPVDRDGTARGDPLRVGRFAGWALTLAVVTYAYQALMVRYFGGTIGKLAVGIRVRTDDGNVVGWREALLRPVLQLIVSVGSFVPGAGLITLLDDLWMLWDRQKQTLHDKVAGTIVVYR